MRSRLTGALAALLVLAPAGASAAALQAPRAAPRVCHAALVPASSSVRATRVTAAETGIVRATLAARGDWDLAVFDARTRRVVAAAASPTGRELAEGFVVAGQRLVVQACRVAGGGARARVRVATVALPAAGGRGPASVVSVATPTRAERDRLAGLGLDLAEGGPRDAVDVVLHDARDAAALRGAGLRWTVRVADLAARDAASLAAGARRGLRATRSALPSRRDDYRRLADYEAELKALAAAHPGLVRLITLAHPSLEGRAVLGVEIARDVNVDDGKPVFLQLGVHHAREWPAGEHPMEWAHELVDGYGTDARVTRLVDATRTIVVPVVNPDGFNLSREAPIDLGVLGPLTPGEIEGVVPVLADQAIGFAYKRRNCRVQDGAVPAPGECGRQANRLLGVDPNRNYGVLWGGPGAGTDRQDDTYRGAGPFSEPEVQNVRELVSAHQVTTLITNHTYGNLILRPPSVQSAPAPFDEPLYRALGDAMAARNGYASQRGFDLYDTSGGTEDWSYAVTGGLGFTFEIGPGEFHPPFAQTVAEYARNREAYFVALESTADATRHAVVTGRAVPGTVIRVHKELDTQTADVIRDVTGAVDPPRAFHDVLDDTIAVGDDGGFAWHLNPSTRPAVAAAGGTEAWAVSCERGGRRLATGSLVIARGERRALDVCALRVTVGVTRRPLGAALRRGLRVRARCTDSCTATATLRLAASAARRLGLGARRAAPVVVAKGRVGRTFRGRRAFTLRFTAAARRRLAGPRGVTLQLVASGRARGAQRATVRRSVRLTR